MAITVTSQPAGELDVDWLILTVTKADGLPQSLAVVDEALGGALTQLREQGDLTGKADETVSLPITTGIAARRVIVVGVGKDEKLSRAVLDRALMTAVRTISNQEKTTVALVLPEVSGERIDPADVAQSCATALTVGSAGQGLYKQKAKRFAFSEMRIVINDSVDKTEMETAAERGRVIGEAMNLTRELVNRTAGEIYPESFAKRIQEEARDAGIDCETWDEQKLNEERMGSLLAVAQGSDRPPRLTILRYRGAGDGSPTLALCGKGVTFDSGGLSIKSNDNMKTMKCDMGGAATALGAITAIARLKLPVNVMAVMGLVENMVSGNSYKLGDVLTARNGVTIEVLNTDAEGRLVLADVLSYTSEQGEVGGIIDLATLTGAVVVALGNDVTGLFANDDAWATDITQAADRAAEDIWQMPMFDSFNEQLESDVADCKNVGTRWGGAITAAKFLEKFVDKKRWAHLDIAGTAYADSDKPHQEGGGTGAMVRTLVEVASRFIVSQ